MKDKILFFLDKDWIHFGIAKSLQNRYDCELFAVVDLDKPSSNFFEEQKLVQFTKIWYYQDYISKKEGKPDLEYLKNFELKYKINLWEIAYSERFFVHYNQFYKFTRDEILYILEKECKLFEEILQESTPKFLVIKITDSHQSHLLHMMCRSLGIKTLMLGWTRFGNRCAIYDEFDKFENMNNVTHKSRTSDELLQFLQSFHSSKAATPMISSKHTLSQRIRKYFQHLILLNSDYVKNYYPHYGKSKFKVMTQFIFMKRKLRRRFIDKNFLQNIPLNSKFVYFPMHTEPERALLLVAPYYTNQIEVITNIARALPMGYKLYVKEHRAMALAGWRDISYYKQILDLPNVELIHPFVDPDDLFKNCSLVITIGGASGVEGAFYGKPSIVFADVSYTLLPTVKRIKNFDELPKAISELIGKQVNPDDLSNYVDIVEANTFEINLIGLHLAFQEYFWEEFSTLKSGVSVSKMNKFLELHNSDFEKLADEHIKKINMYNKP
jgi:hypothetical protein